jgi:hypothetical protein
MVFMHRDIGVPVIDGNVIGNLFIYWIYRRESDSTSLISLRDSTSLQRFRSNSVVCTYMHIPAINRNLPWDVPSRAGRRIFDDDTRIREVRVDTDSFATAFSLWQNSYPRLEYCVNDNAPKKPCQCSNPGSRGHEISQLWFQITECQLSRLYSCSKLEQAWHDCDESPWLHSMRPSPEPYICLES